jgi:hypothetical protein
MISFSKLIIGLVSLVICVQVYAQKVWGKHLGEDEFPVEGLADAVLDENNLLWLGYYGKGVKAYNGSAIVYQITTKNNLPSNFVVDLFSKNDSLFIVQDKYFSLWYKGEITHIPVPNLNNSEELAAFYIDAKGRTWLTSDYGKIIQYNNNFTSYRLFDFDSLNNSHYLFHITSDYQGNTWFASDLGMVLKYENGSFININQKYGIEFLTHNDFFPTDSCMYIADEAGFFKLKKDTAICLINPLYLDETGPVHNIRNITNFKGKTIVYTMYGISEVEIKNNSVEFLATYTQYNSSVYYGFNRMFVDKNNILWIVTFSNGLYQIIDFDTKTFTPHDFLKNINDINIVNIEKGTGNNLLVEMAGYFAVLDTKTDSFKTIVSSLDNEVEISSIFPLDSNYTRYWQSTESSGMVYVDKNKGIYKPYCQCGTPNSIPTINSAVMLAPDSFFVFQSTVIGIFHKNKYTFLKIKHDNTADLIENRSDSAIYKDLQFYNIELHNHKIYIASTDGIYIWDGKNMQHIDHPKLVNTGIDILTFDKNNNIWLYTLSGKLLCYYPQNNEVKDYTSWINPQIKGLPMLLTIHKNNVWLDVYQKIELNNVSVPVKSETYISAPINNTYERLKSQPVFVDDWVYLSTGKRLLKVPQKLFRETHSTPDIEWLEIYNVIDSSYVSTSINEFKHNKSTLKIKYTVNDFLVLPKNIKTEYAVVLNNSDTSIWSDISDESSLLFANISPGNYQILLRTRYVDSDKNKTVNIGSFSILPAWYNTWLFYGMVLLFIFSAVYWYFMQKQKRLQFALETEKQIALLQHKALQAQMNPHFIFNVLNTIQYHVLENETEKTLEVLSKFSKLIRGTFDLVGKDTISLHQEIKYLENYIQVEALRFDGKFEYAINTDNNLNLFDIKIPPLIIQPYVENVFKHAFEKPVSKTAKLTIDFMQQDNYLIIKISDNGKGYVPTQKNLNAESATSLTEKRLEALNKQIKKQNYSVHIESNNIDENGTIVTIKIVIEK